MTFKQISSASCCLLLLLAFSAIAVAQDMSVFGMKLGSPIATPECRRGDLYYESSSATICYERTNIFGLFNAQNYGKKNPRPPLGTEVIRLNYPYAEKPQIAQNSIEASIIEGKLEGISFITDGPNDAELVMQELKEKYGAPTSLVPKKVQNGLGVSFVSLSAVWAFPDLKVVFESVYRTLDHGLVTIETEKGSTWRAKQMEKSLKDDHPL